MLYYQSPMHPWVKSERPGKCTVCGMDLVAVYEGGRDAAQEHADLVMLPQGSPTAAGVRTSSARVVPLVRTLRVAGMIEDDDSRHRILSAYVAGRIEKLFLNFEGADVEEGQPLALFYSKELLGAANEYRSALRQGNAALAAAGENRLRQLGLAAAQIAQVPKRVESEVTFEILAPRSGTVTKRHVFEGQYVSEGEKLFEIADFSVMWFQFVAYEQDLPFLEVGQKVEISTPSLAGRSLRSTIKFINPNLDEATRSARVRVEVVNPVSPQGRHRGHEMLHKLSAQAVVEVAAPEVLAVPHSAVLWPGSGPRVYVELAPGTYEQRRVRLGRVGDDSMEVLEGVKEGEKVVVSGNMLIDGQAQLNNLGGGDASGHAHALEQPAAATLVPGSSAATAPAGNAGPAQTMVPATAPATVTPEVLAYLKAAAAVGEALADDQLAAYNGAVRLLPPGPEGLRAPPPAEAADLLGARRQFLVWSEALVEWVLPRRAGVPGLHVFRCPMSNQVGPGAPKNARWLQWSAQLRNPYMGQEMLSCGTEVRP